MQRDGGIRESNHQRNGGAHEQQTTRKVALVGSSHGVRVGSESERRAMCVWEGGRVRTPFHSLLDCCCSGTRLIHSFLEVSLVWYRS